MPLKLESLEGRDVPAADVLLDGPNLVITADGDDDTVFVSEAGGLVFLNVNGVEFEPLPSEAVQFVTFDGGGGDDVFVNASGAFGYADGGFGWDILVGGPAGNVLLGGPGADILVGGVGNDFLLGEGGDDLFLGGPGFDTMIGGPGFNQYLDPEPIDVIDDGFSGFGFGGVFVDDGFDDSFDDSFDD